MASEALEETTPYELLGGDSGVRRLTADFYGLMCMREALKKTSLDASMAARLVDSFGRMAEMCRTKD